MTIKKTIAANVTYGGATFNTRLIVEYKHTGTIFETKRAGNNVQTYSQEIADNWKAKGKKVVQHLGYYFIDRLAIPNGKTDFWYINNPGDFYQINKVSKYGQKLHAELSKMQPEKLNS